LKVYGITHCDTVKKARAWLAARGIAYQFVDFRKAPPAPLLLARWCAELGWEAVVNRRGTTWRTLAPEVQASVRDDASAVALLAAKPAAIRRPVVEAGAVLLIGFDEKTWAQRLPRAAAPP
jgi:arsenate reductase